MLVRIFTVRAVGQIKSCYNVRKVLCIGKIQKASIYLKKMVLILILILILLFNFIYRKEETSSCVKSSVYSTSPWKTKQFSFLKEVMLYNSVSISAKDSEEKKS